MWRNRWRGHFANFYARLDTAVMLAKNDRAKFAAIAKWPSLPSPLLPLPPL
jgi:hypothetical protein